MNYRSIIFFIVGTWLAITLNLYAADSVSPDSDLQELFAMALESCDEEYQKIRTMIIAQENSSAFLVKQTLSTNLMIRVIGQAMLSWQTNGTISLLVNARYVERTRDLAMSQVGERRILSEIYDIKSMPRKFRFKDDPYIILEMALKGPTLSENSGVPTARVRDGAVRCYAAGMSGRYDDLDILSVLVHLTGENENDFMRESALLGLRLREDADMSVFLKGIEDRNQDYRKTCYIHLRDTTGQDFGYDAEKYRMWLETNTVSHAAQPAK
jgi:hypothetical protein